MDKDANKQGQNSKPIYIYALRCPITGEIRYIGQSNQPERRFGLHLFAAQHRYYKHHACRWLQLLKDRNLEPTLEVLCRVPDGDDWRDYERRYIALARASGFKLTNQTIGGEGVEFVSQDDLLRAKAARKKGMQSPDVKKRMSESMKAFWAIPANRAKMVQHNKDWANTPDGLEQLKRAGLMRTHESGRRQAASLRATVKRKYSNPEFSKYPTVIAQQTGIHPSTVYRFFRGKRIGDIVYWKIVAALKVDICPLGREQTEQQLILF
jgi:hypothetical protein